MIRRNPSGHLPEIHESAYVDQTAILCGKVVVQENVFLGPYVVIRADEVNAEGDMEPIVIGAHSNIQDGVVIHSKSGAAVIVGERTSIAATCLPASMCHLASGSAAIPRVSAQTSEFSEDVARTNNELARGYKRLQNEF